MSSIKDLIDMGILDPDFGDVKGIVNVSSNHAYQEIKGESEHESEPESDDYVPYRSSLNPPSPVSDQENQPVFIHRNTYNRKKFNTEDLDDDFTSSSDEVESDNFNYFKDVNYHWLYSSNSTGWWHFDEKHNEKLERKYLSGKDRTKLLVQDKKILINFGDMTQRLGGRLRNIIRVESVKDIYLRGIGGSPVTKDKLFNETNTVPV